MRGESQYVRLYGTVNTSSGVYMRSPAAPSDFTLKGPIQDYLDFKGLYFVKRLR